MNLYNVNNEYVFTQGFFINETLIAQGTFTLDEQRFCIGYEDGHVVIDNNKKQAFLNELKRAKKDEISIAYVIERDETNKGILSPTLSEMIDCRKTDVQNVSTLISALEREGITNFYYKLKNNTMVPCTVSQIKLVYGEMCNELLNIWKRKQELLALIDSASTEEQILSIVWSY